MTTVETAELLLVSTETVRQWAQKGTLRAQLTAGGHRRYFVKDVEAFAHSKGIPLNHDSGTNEIRILVVDDDPGMVTLVFDFLKMQYKDIILESASNGFEAGQKIFRFKPSLIILDIMMPGISGVEVCKEIKSNADTRDIKIIAITGYYTDDVISTVLRAGANECLSKPLKLATLQDAINRYCNVELKQTI